MELPSGKLVYSSTPIYPGSNFTWGEATRNCSRTIENLIIDGRLYAEALSIEQTIVLTAQKLDDIRICLGNRPIWINSWYRPNNINSRVGGSRFSRHQFGDGVDIRSNYLTSHQIYKQLEPSHYDGGIHYYHSFVHIDWRGELARW